MMDNEVVEVGESCHGALVDDRSIDRLFSELGDRPSGRPTRENGVFHNCLVVASNQIAAHEPAGRASLTDDVFAEMLWILLRPLPSRSASPFSDDHCGSVAATCIEPAAGGMADVVDGVHYIRYPPVHQIVGSGMERVIEQVREFNRTWTEVLGLLDEGLLKTERTLAEARVIFELAQRDTWERLELRHRLGMDASFLTRVLNRLEAQRLVTSSQSAADGRALVLSLTEAGRSAFAELDRRSIEQIDELLRPLTADQRATLAESMTLIRQMTRAEHSQRAVTLRGLEPGDMGWVIQRHGAIYADELGWSSDFEALVAQIVADYHTDLTPGRANAWIAEVDGARAGCVFCCERDTETAQLRILLVEPWARGLGLGTLLVERCVEFATAAGYQRLMLWTNDVLTFARRIYEAAGFRLVHEEHHHSFGHDLVGQNWELALT